MNFSTRFKKEIPLIWFAFGLLIKLLLSWYFTSDLLLELFIPFVSHFTDTGFASPYDAFVDRAGVSAFPYPALMLYILSISNFLLGWISENQNYTQFIFRLPLLAADILIFVILKNWLKPRNFNKLVLYYWCSPVLIYISYVHGQLDVIPISLLFVCLYFLFRDHFAFSALFMGLALATKTNVAIVLPFFLIFLVRKNVNFVDLVKFAMIVAITFALVNIQFLHQPAFLKMVFNNHEQRKIFDLAIRMENLSLYIVPLILIVIFFRGMLIRIYNRDIFLMFLGFTFCTLLFFIPPMPGWYFWLIPFLCYFYIKQDTQYVFLLFTLQSCYFIYFYHKEATGISFEITPDVVSVNQLFQPSLTRLMELGGPSSLDISFTFLQVILLINCAWIYQRGLESYSRHKITVAPFLIGIGGDSGVGKTTLADAMTSIFGLHNTTVLRGDDMHKWQRGHEKWKQHTHLDPKANHLHKEIYFLKRLKSGQKILRQHYDHDTGEFTEEKPILAKNILIFEGLHPFFLAPQRLLYDLKIFIKPAKELQMHWKIIRDQAKRGYKKDEIIEAIEAREIDANKYINTQTNKSDFLIEVFPQNPIEKIGEKKEQLDIYYQLSFSNEIFVELLLDSLRTEPSINIEHEYTENDLQMVIISGSCSSKFLQDVASEFIGELDDLGISIKRLPDGVFGVLLVVLIYVVFEKEMYDRQ